MESTLEFDYNLDEDCLFLHNPREKSVKFIQSDEFKFGLNENNHIISMNIISAQKTLSEIFKEEIIVNLITSISINDFREKDESIILNVGFKDKPTRSIEVRDFQ